MKYVDLQHAAEGQELSFLTLDLIQEGSRESIQSIVRALGVLDNEITILWGLNVVQNGSDYAISSGAVFYNNEIHLVDAFVGNSVVDVPVLKADFIDLEGPVRFTSQNEYSVYYDNKLMIELGASGGGIIDLDNAVRFADVLAKRNQGVWSDIALSAEYSVVTGQTAQYRKDQFGVIHLRGSVSIDAGTNDVVAPVDSVPGIPVGTGSRVGFLVPLLGGAAGDAIRVEISDTGLINLPAGSAAAFVGQSIYLNGISYSQDTY